MYCGNFRKRRTNRSLIHQNLAGFFCQLRKYRAISISQKGNGGVVVSRFSGKVVVITGGGSGIGAATARAFALEGAKVIVADLNENAGQEVVNQILSQGGSATFIQTDVAQEDSVANLFAKAEEIKGKIDIVHANAGIYRTNSVADLPLEEWNLVIGVNLTGVMLTGKYAVRSMLETGGGTIINTASIAGLVGIAESPAYNAAKGGVVLLTRNMALDYAKQGIRVNAICPGYVETPLIQNHIQSFPEAEGKAMYEGLFALHPMGRLATPAEIAKAVLFLASDDASFITGHTLTIDGGYTIV